MRLGVVTHDKVHSLVSHRCVYCLPMLTDTGQRIEILMQCKLGLLRDVLIPPTRLHIQTSVTCVPVCTCSVICACMHASSVRALTARTKPGLHVCNAWIRALRTRVARGRCLLNWIIKNAVASRGVGGSARHFHTFDLTHALYRALIM